jgi:hypothetical protein
MLNGTYREVADPYGGRSRPRVSGRMSRESQYVPKAGVGSGSHLGTGGGKKMGKTISW